MKRDARTRFLSLLLTFFLLIWAAPVSEAKTTVDLWHYWGDIWEDYFNAWIERFNESHDEIEIKALSIPWGDFYTKLLTAIASGTGPDVAVMDGWYLPGYAQKGALMPVNDFVARDPDVDPDMYFEVQWDEGTWNGQTWGLYYVGGISGLFWNKEVFRDVGLDPERPPQTWSETDQYNEKITLARNGDLERIGFLPWTGNWLPLYVWAWLNGGDFYDEENNQITASHPRNVEALEWIVSYPKTYGPDAIDKFQSGWGSMWSADSPFIKGQLAMIYQGNWEMTTLRDFAPDLDYGVAPPPAAREGVPTTTISGGGFLVIPRGSDNPNAAWEAAKWLSLNGSDERAISGTDMVWLERSLEVPEIRNDEKFMVFANMLPTARHAPAIPVVQFYTDKLGEALDFAVHLRKTPEQALRDVDQVVQAELDKLSR